jgi:hypothetical protein
MKWIGFFNLNVGSYGNSEYPSCSSEQNLLNMRVSFAWGFEVT